MNNLKKTMAFILSGMVAFLVVWNFAKAVREVRGEVQTWWRRRQIQLQRQASHTEFPHNPITRR